MTSQLIVAVFGAAPRLGPFDRLPKLIIRISERCVCTTSVFSNYAVMNCLVILKFFVASATRTAHIRSVGGEKYRELLLHRVA